MQTHSVHIVKGKKLLHMLHNVYHTPTLRYWT